MSNRETASMSAVIDMSEGRRDRKRREIHERVANSALDLFVKNGFEETTIDEIADAADISRRSFFHYFAAKEDVVFFWKNEFFETMLDAAQGSGEVQPMELVEQVLMAVARRYEGARIIAIDKLIRTTLSLTATTTPRSVPWPGRWPRSGRSVSSLRCVLLPSSGSVCSRPRLRPGAPTVTARRSWNIWRMDSSCCGANWRNPAHRCPRPPARAADQFRTPRG
jgi:AcrR family transcriptional regulator